MYSIKGMNQKRLYMIVSFIFFTIVSFSIYSVYYIQQCVNQEVQSEANKSKYHSLSQKIVDLNNDKTDEVRKFIATGNIEYFKNYWKTIGSIDEIQDTIRHTKKDKLMAQESQYLNTAIEDLTLLSYIDLRSMRLMTDALAVDHNQLPQAVREYVINIDEKEMSRPEKRHQALELLFDKNYISEKNVITNNILSFRRYVDERLDHKLNEAKKGVQFAVKLQSWLQLFFIITFMGVLVLLYLYNVKPIRSYTKTLANHSEISGSYHLQPSGSIETKLLAKAFNRLYRRLIKANQAKSDFLSMISHELRTPLNSIIGYKFLLDRTNLTKKQEDYLKIIGHSSKLLLLLINQILDYEKIEKGKLHNHLKDFDIEKSMRNVISMFQFAALKKNINLIYEPAKQLPRYIRGDPQLINQIVINLVSNAIKFTSKGYVKLSVCVRQQDLPDAEKLVISVSDTGIGIKKEYFTKIFQAFEQASENISTKFGGSGLGLAISKKIATDLGGTIDVYSTFRKGSVFTVSLPVKKVIKTSLSQNHSLVGHKGRFSGISALLVEDNVINLKMEKEILMLLGFQVTAVSSGYEAMKKIESETYHFVFLDIRLPDRNGYRVAEFIRHSVLNRKTCLIALTANVEEATQNGTDFFNAFLPKPFEAEQLIAVIDHNNVNKEPNTQNQSILNYQATLRRLDNKQTLYIELLKMFLRDHGKDDEKYHKLFLTHQYDRCRIFIHQLNGVSASVGAERLAFICNKITIAFKIQLPMISDNEQKAKAHWVMLAHDLSDTLIQTKKGIKNYLNAIEKKKNDRKKPLPLKQTSHVMDTLLSLIRRSDGYCYRYVDEYEIAIKHYISQNLYDQLKDALYHFDYQRAGRLLKKGK
ncbi:MAG: ATP-binding protein [Sporolactobacillus sp.]|jgi:signal transduction histidine kinase/CheY-like chemotaxis protein|nr:ATP-binding protein [Sporolactobacillus sp.]